MYKYVYISEQYQYEAQRESIKNLKSSLLDWENLIDNSLVDSNCQLTNEQQQNPITAGGNKTSKNNWKNEP